MKSNLTTDGFTGLGIAPKLLGILDGLGFSSPTPIQQQSIPPALEGKDIIGIAQTGTGKTLAFGIPMLQRLVSFKGQGLVVLPTRELAIQVNQSLERLGKTLGLRTAILIGGEPIGRQLGQLKRMPHIIIGTPGRLIDHMEQKTLKLNSISVLVLDEADRMLDMGFMPQINKILVEVPKDRQTLLFSATMPSGVSEIAMKFMKLPLRVEVAPPGTTAKRVSQELFFVTKNAKLNLLLELIKKYSGSILVFSRTKFGAKKISAVLRKSGLKAVEIHSNRSLSQRLEALNGFKLGKYKILVATDIAARGLDVTGIEVVINYDLPENPDDYVHRIGRTARAEKTGHAISFATPEQKRDVKDIERLIRSQLPVSSLPRLTESVTEIEREEYKPRPYIEKNSRPKSGRTGGQYSKKNFSMPKFRRSQNPSATETSTVEYPGLMFRFGGESVSSTRLPARKPDKFKDFRKPKKSR